MPDFLETSLTQMAINDPRSVCPNRYIYKGSHALLAGAKLIVGYFGLFQLFDR